MKASMKARWATTICAVGIVLTLGSTAWAAPRPAFSRSYLPVTRTPLTAVPPVNPPFPGSGVGTGNSGSGGGQNPQPTPSPEPGPGVGPTDSVDLSPEAQGPSEYNMWTDPVFWTTFGVGVAVTVGDLALDALGAAPVFADPNTSGWGPNSNGCQKGQAACKALH